jgi:hypothetical protein
MTDRAATTGLPGNDEHPWPVPPATDERSRLVQGPLPRRDIDHRQWRHRDRGACLTPGTGAGSGAGRDQGRDQAITHGDHPATTPQTPHNRTRPTASQEQLIAAQSQSTCTGSAPGTGCVGEISPLFVSEGGLAHYPHACRWGRDRLSAVPAVPGFLVNCFALGRHEPVVDLPKTRIWAWWDMALEPVIAVPNLRRTSASCMRDMAGGDHRATVHHRGDR